MTQCPMTKYQCPPDASTWSTSMPCFLNSTPAFQAKNARYAKPNTGTMYERCMPLIPEKECCVVSANIPCTGGIMEPPNIIIIKNAEPWLVYFPKPATAKAKIDGHIMEQHKPPLIKANKPIRPVVNNPTTIANTPNKPKIVKVRTGFCWPT